MTVAIDECEQPFATNQTLYCSFRVQVARVQVAIESAFFHSHRHQSHKKETKKFSLQSHPSTSCKISENRTLLVYQRH